MKKFIQSEIDKRIKAKKHILDAKEAWKNKKVEIEEIFRDLFQQIKVDDKEFRIENTLNSPLSNKKYFGYDCVQVTHPARLTSNAVVTQDGESTKFQPVREVGAALSVTFSGIGGVNVFLIPSQNDDAVQKKQDILIFSTRDPNKISKRIIRSFVKKYLIFQRVDSLLEISSIRDEVYISWLRFHDVRNREKKESLYFRILNHWGAVVVSALAGWVVAKIT